MLGRIGSVLLLLVSGGLLAAADGTGVVVPDRVAALVAEMKRDQELEEVGAEILQKASAARLKGSQPLKGKAAGKVKALPRIRNAIRALFGR